MAVGVHHVWCIVLLLNAMDKDATASGRPAKLQKLHDLRRGVPYVSKSALEGILKTIQESVGAEGADKGQGVTVKAELVGGNAREHAATSLASSSKLAMKMCPSVWAGASTTGVTTCTPESTKGEDSGPGATPKPGMGKMRAPQFPLLPRPTGLCPRPQAQTGP